MSSIERNQMPAWSVGVLALAGLYNIAWGGLMVLWPNGVFQLTGATLPNYPELWQCIGMIVGVYGLGYLIAATDPRRHWPIVLVGLLGKIFGPMGFAWALIQQRFPLAFGVNILTNDLIWWVPFSLILKSVYDLWRLDIPVHPFLSLTEALQAPLSPQKPSLADCSEQAPLLLLFLRHSGCTFCRETLAELAQEWPRLQAAGLQVAVVMMSESVAMQALWQQNSLDGVRLISDPDRRFYRAFGLTRATWRQVFGLGVWLRGFQAWTQKGHGIGPLDGDGFQLGGSFLLRHGRVVWAHPQTHAGDRVPWEQIMTTVSTTSGL